MDGTVHSSKPFMSLMYSTCACMYVTDIKQVSRQICVIYVSRQPAYLIPPADVFGHVQLIDGFWRVDDLWRHEHQQRHGGRQQAQHFLWCQNSKLQVSTSNTQDSRLFFCVSCNEIIESCTDHLIIYIRSNHIGWVLQNLLAVHFGALCNNVI